MDIDIARHVIRTVFRSGRELEGLIPLEHCDAQEYAIFGKGVAHALAAMTTELTNKVLSAHPELNDQIEADLAKYGRFL